VSGTLAHLHKTPESGHGPRIGPYELLARLSKKNRPAQCATYRARNLETGWPVCVKVSKSEPPATEEQRKVFARKMTVLHKLNHPFLVSVVDAGWEIGFKYLVMNHVKGDSLDKIVRLRGPLPETALARVGLRLLAALEYLHERELLHCNVSPNHVMIRCDGVVKLAGLFDVQPAGLRTEGDAAGFGSTKNCEISPYTPPEVLSSLLPLDRRTDFYGLGATLHFAATGRPPFGEAKGLRQLTRMVKNRPPDSPRRKNKGISPDLAELLGSLMGKAPGRRPSSLEDIRARLSRLLEITTQEDRTEGPEHDDSAV